MSLQSLTKGWVSLLELDGEERRLIALAESTLITRLWILRFFALWMPSRSAQSSAMRTEVVLVMTQSMEHGFRCMTNLLNLYNSMNIIDPK